MAVLPQPPTEEDYQKLHEENTRLEKLVARLREQVKAQSDVTKVQREIAAKRNLDYAYVMHLVGILHSQMKTSEQLVSMLVKKYKFGGASEDEDR